MLNKSATVNHSRLLWGVVVFFVVAAIGLYWSKWNPYYHKAFTAANEHSIGASIISGEAATAAAPSWHTAWEYCLVYFKAIWKAFIVGIILASLVQVLVPRDWIRRVLGKTSYGSTLIAGLSSLPGMMCTCCAAPVVVGLRNQSSSVGAAVAFWFGNTALNPAVLIFMFFVLGWKFTVLRLLFGIILVFGVSYLANRFVKENANAAAFDKNVVEPLPVQEGSLWTRWVKSLGTMSVSLIPAYILTVLTLGAFRAWLFPAIGDQWGNSLLVIIGFAIVGTLFVIPTAAEIPIIQTMMSFGLGGGPAAALLITLPVISLPSMLMVGRSLTWRVIAFLAASVAVVGVIAGLIGRFVL
ncbi:permease [Siminovitchia fortis]|uniref:Permease n=1 Tax=Siminovitchia fortis TaxID=254758 RepID=A0A443ISU9_9BACI|nr:permease [Siminovitchia fortis]RWR10053.1 permease [Siminovitchia fortis]WHY80732.1 permease [Siminovitchia fortis]